MQYKQLAASNILSWSAGSLVPEGMAAQPLATVCTWGSPSVELAGEAPQLAEEALLP